MNIATLLTSSAMILLTAAACTSARQSADTSAPGGVAVGWHHSHETRVGDTTVVTLPSAGLAGGIRGGSGKSAVMPLTRIYRTNGDYADRVPITLNASRTELLSYPAPGDLKGAEPVRLDDGFLLDNRGIGANTAFTSWTYAEYMAMPSAPSAAEIMKHILPDARVTEIYEMPFTVGTPDAARRCNELISAGLPACTPVLTQLKMN